MLTHTRSADLERCCAGRQNPPARIRSSDAAGRVTYHQCELGCAESMIAALPQTFSPVNRFPNVVRYAVQQSKLCCPALDKLKVAEKLPGPVRRFFPSQGCGQGERMERRKESNGGDRRSVEKGGASSLRLSSLLSPLTCSIAAERQWRRPRRLETGIVPTCGDESDGARERRK